MFREEKSMWKIIEINEGREDVEVLQLSSDLSFGGNIGYLDVICRFEIRVRCRIIIQSESL